MPEITEQEQELFNRYRELGEPDAISALLQERETLRVQSLINETAQLTGFKPSVLEKLVAGLDLKVDNGKAYIGDVLVTDYAEQNWSDFLPSLKSETPSNGVSFVRQPSKPNNGAVDKNRVVADYLKTVYGGQAGN